MNFVTKVILKIKSGNGGNGIISWRRESLERFGGPSGGNGGDGGNVYLVGDINLNSLYHLKSKKLFFSESGENGKSKNMHGKHGQDLFIRVPCGTNIHDVKNNTKITELLVDGQQFLICSGGKGGKGNCFFKSSTRPAPCMYELGDIGEEKEIELDLESIADVGFLGFPNAGKSTLLSKISNANPKIADFPFTTLIPVLGVVEFKSKKIVFADIPGLIEGASDGAGLGFEFLKHLNRCKIILHIVECSTSDLIEKIEAIEHEILQYSEQLFNKPRLLCINKIDQFSEEELVTIKKEIADKLNTESIFISAKNNINLDTLITKSCELYEQNFTEEVVVMDYLEFNDPEYKNETPKIWEDGDTWHVESHALKYWIHKIPQTTTDNICRLRHKIKNLGIEKELIKSGAKPSSNVQIYFFKFSL